jgi:hypothetical protein
MPFAKIVKNHQNLGIDMPAARSAFDINAETARSRALGKLRIAQLDALILDCCRKVV